MEWWEFCFYLLVIGISISAVWIMGYSKGMYERLHEYEKILEDREKFYRSVINRLNKKLNDKSDWWKGDNK